MFKTLAISVFTVAALFLGCSEHSYTADDRLREVLAISKDQKLSEEVVAARMLEILPVGTHEAEIANKTLAMGVGRTYSTLRNIRLFFVLTLI